MSFCATAPCADRCPLTTPLPPTPTPPHTAGALTLTAFISPYRADRDMVRARCAPGEFLEVHMAVPLEVCEARDPKGLYKKARAGLIKNFTGGVGARAGGRGPIRFA